MKTRHEITVGGELYRISAIQDWTREQLQPITRQYVIENNLLIDRSWLFTKGRDIHLGLLFGDTSVRFLAKSGGLVNHEGEYVQIEGNGTGKLIDPPPAPVHNNGNGNHDGDSRIADVLAEVLKGRISGGIDPEAIKEQVEEIVNQHLSRREKVSRVILDGNNGELPKDLGIHHAKFPLLLKLMNIKARGKRHNIALVGPAGTGKTHEAHEAAKALGLSFNSIPVGPQTTKSDLIGYMDAKGEYVSTAIRFAFEFGGVVLLDEMDAANAGVLTVLNQLTSNTGAGWPDGKFVMRHPDFIVLCGMNTHGNGADSKYVGRNELDAATLSRFAMVYWDQDNALEMHLTGNDDWCLYVQKVRKAVEGLKIGKAVISPRASYDGAEALATGVSREDAEQLYIWKGMKTTEKAKVLAAMA